MKNTKHRLLLGLICLLNWSVSNAQILREFNPDLGASAVSWGAPGEVYRIDRPLFSLEINQAGYAADNLPKGLHAGLDSLKIERRTARLRITLSNSGPDTLLISNLVPFGRAQNMAMITGKGDHRLSRSHLFLIQPPAGRGA